MSLAPALWARTPALEAPGREDADTSRERHAASPRQASDRGRVVVLLAASTACARSDEERIRRQLEELAQTVSVEDTATPMIREARATHLTTYLTPAANVDGGAPFSPVVGRDAVRQVAAAVRVPVA